MPNQRRQSGGFLAGLCLWVWSAAVSAQDADFAELQKDLAIFSGILEDSLRLTGSTGLFGMSLGGVEATYLHGQGAVLEIRSPLAARRNRMGLASLGTAMQALQQRPNPFEAMRRSAAEGVQIGELAATGALEATGYQQLLDRIASIDYSMVAQSAVRQAFQSARALKALGEEDAAHATLEQELASLRAAVDANVQALRKLEQEIGASTSDSADADFNAQLESLLQAFEPVRDMALEKADELRELYRQKEEEYAAVWQQDLEEFRSQLYRSVCEYGSTLRSLPDTENLSLVLRGLGADRSDNRRTAEVHVLSSRDVRACGQGEIDVGTLHQRTMIYTF